MGAYAVWEIRGLVKKGKENTAARLYDFNWREFHNRQKYVTRESETLLRCGDQGRINIYRQNVHRFGGTLWWGLQCGGTSCARAHCAHWIRPGWRQSRHRQEVGLMHDTTSCGCERSLYDAFSSFITQTNKQRTCHGGLIATASCGKNSQSSAAAVFRGCQTDQ